jgi:PPOX class probable F420-dependent enzyme
VPEATRPKFPGVYGIHAGDEGLLDWCWAEERLVAARNYWVTTVRPDGSPHAMPVWGLWHEAAFYFSSSPEARKAQNLATNPAVAMHLESGDEVVVVEGRADYERDEDLLRRLGEDYSSKYSFDVSFTGGRPLLVVRPRVAYAWVEQEFPKTAIRFTFPAR